jgi:radial spoke head protein 9
LNESKDGDFEELTFWGRVNATSGYYYIAMGICYSGRYEFPEKKFFWCNKANGMVFEAFPKLNDYWQNSYDEYSKDPFKGDPKLVLKAAPVIESSKIEEHKQKLANRNEDLDTSIEEEPEDLKQHLDLKEIDRLLNHVLCIEHECHIIPHGAMKLTTTHEVARNEAFLGLKPDQ